MIVTIKTSLIRLSTFHVFLLLSTLTNGQVNNFKNNEKIRISATEFLQILRCKGEEEKKVCEVAYFVNNKRVGSPFWLTVAAIKQKTQIDKRTVQPKVITKNKAAVPKIVTKQIVQQKKNLPPPKTEQKTVESTPAKPANDFATQLNKAIGNKDQKQQEVKPKAEVKNPDSLFNNKYQ